MPALALLAMGAVGGFLFGRGADGATGIIKWSVIGGAVFVAAKAFKVW